MGRKRKTREPHQPSLHFIVEWADKRGLKPVDFVNALGVDKGTVSRWFAGKLPHEDNIPRIAAFLEISIDDLFRLPGDDWMQRFFHNRSIEEIKRMRDTLEAAFPRKSDEKDGTNG